MSHLRSSLTLAVLLSAGCAAPSSTLPGVQAPVASSVTVSVGPCFGFCPVFTVEVRSSGEVVFEGLRHTAEIGRRTRQISPATLSELQSVLAPFRAQPAESFPCTTMVSDQSTITIAWQQAGRTIARRDHDRGCQSPAGEQLERAVADVLARTGVDVWARQVTRPAAQRG